MRLQNTALALGLSLLYTLGESFTTSIVPSRTPFVSSNFKTVSTTTTPLTLLFANEDKESEIDRLRTMAAKLRAEAAAKEAELKLQVADATQRAFDRFDTDRDGKISFTELKAGLEKQLKMDLPESRVQKLLEKFDTSGDGSLQPAEFKTIEQMRNILEQIARDEKQAAVEMTKQAKVEEEAYKLMEARREILNDREPDGKDKLFAILPYLFPLMDGLTYARFLLVENQDNPISIALALTYALYRSVPFSGFIAFFALNLLSGNPTINRLVRFNMQQAIFLDIALFFPGLVAGLLGIIGGQAGVQLPATVVTLGNDAIFFTLLAVIGYSATSSLLGITPDKVPFVSDAVNDRMPTVDMFDAEGRFIPRKKRDNDENK
jgi:hypothetical protein